MLGRLRAPGAAPRAPAPRAAPPRAAAAPSRRRVSTATKRPDTSGDVPVNGAVFNGASTNGGALNGAAMRAALNGAAPRAAPAPPPRAAAPPLPRVLLIHTGGTLGMDPERSYESADAELGVPTLRRGTGGAYSALKPRALAAALGRDLLARAPELQALARVEVRVAFNRDSSNVGPAEWARLARLLDSQRDYFDAFLLVSGTDTLAFTAAALSLMLAGFGKPIVITGSQIPLAMPRSDARQNLVDALTCAVAAHYPPHAPLREVAVCFGGRLLRGNRAQKVHTSLYQAFDSPSWPCLARLGVGVEWARGALLDPVAVYRPRFELEPAVIRVPVVPGCDPRLTYGDLFGRGVRGIVLEAFGVGNLPNKWWVPWLREQTKKGLRVCLRSQSVGGELHPELYKAGAEALRLGAEAGPQMTAECSVVKLMLVLKFPDIPLALPLAGEL
jgi:L-asparaginase